MNRLLRSVVLAAAVSAVLCVAFDYAHWMAPIVPGLAALVVGVAYGIERKQSGDESLSLLGVSLAASAVAVGASAYVCGLPIKANAFSLLSWLAAASMAPMVGIAMNGLAGRSIRAQSIAGIILVLALIPGAIHTLP